jgi:hypothetical protein
MAGRRFSAKTPCGGPIEVARCTECGTNGKPGGHCERCGASLTATCSTNVPPGKTCRFHPDRRKPLLKGDRPMSGIAWFKDEMVRQGVAPFSAMRAADRSALLAAHLTALSLHEGDASLMEVATRANTMALGAEQLDREINPAPAPVEDYDWNRLEPAEQAELERLLRKARVPPKSA